MSDFGDIEDGFGNCWAKCKEDCGLEIVRPGKVQCDCDYICAECGGEIRHYSEQESPFEHHSGWFCVNCTMQWATFKEEYREKYQNL